MASQPEQHQVRETITLRFARLIVRQRFWVSLLLILTTLFFLYPTVNAVSSGFGYPLPGPTVRVDASVRSQWPDHPYIHAQDKFAKTFGSSSLVAIAVVVKEGTIFTPETMKKLSRITHRLDGEGYDSRTDEREAYRDELEENLPEDEEINTFELIKLPVDIYMIAFVPFRIKILDLLAIVGVALLISFLSTLFPSHRASRVDPVNALKYE